MSDKAILNKTPKNHIILTYKSKKFLMSCLYDIEHALRIVESPNIEDHTDKEKKLVSKNDYLLDRYQQFKTQRVA